MKKIKKFKTAISFKIFKVDENGFHLSLSAKINGKKSNLILDTGASRSVFDKKISKLTKNSAEAKPSDKLSTGIGNTKLKSELLEIDEIKIGDLIIKNYETVLIDLSYVNEAYRQSGNKKIEGILGCDILKKYKAMIDFPNKKLFLSYKK